MGGLKEGRSRCTELLLQVGQGPSTTTSAAAAAAAAAEGSVLCARCPARTNARIDRCDASGRRKAGGSGGAHGAEPSLRSAAGCCQAFSSAGRRADTHAAPPCRQASSSASLVISDTARRSATVVRAFLHPFAGPSTLHARGAHASPWPPRSRPRDPSAAPLHARRSNCAPLHRTSASLSLRQIPLPTGAMRASTGPTPAMRRAPCSAIASRPGVVVRPSAALAGLGCARTTGAIRRSPTVDTRQASASAQRVVKAQVAEAAPPSPLPVPGPNGDGKGYVPVTEVRLSL